ncbi:hypothetical protein PsorP6_011331 [Peronosclerospora sorghi]|uniref:Uncharacterized protein n=1 Tax=Peronosclerospora sorghi TaxID=230839 RepID=A0ACC0WJ42_9STRA|nr:hypothetical protein PsorP6_011331 [Peronosclerospora sorghi]
MELWYTGCSMSLLWSCHGDVGKNGGVTTAESSLFFPLLDEWERYPASASSNTCSRGPFSFRIHGQLYHQVGPLLPKVGQRPLFAPLYIHDTEHEREKRHAVMLELNDAVLNELQTMLHEKQSNPANPYVQQFRTTREQGISASREFPTSTQFSLRLLATRSRDARQYNVPTSR